VKFLEAARRAVADQTRLWGTADVKTVADADDDAPAVITLTIGDERTAPHGVAPMDRGDGEQS
jgi:hypothetical protein